MKEYYEILGLSENATLEDVNNAYEKIKAELYQLQKNGKISRGEFRERYDAVTIAHDSIIANAKNVAAERIVSTDVEKEIKKEVKKDQSVEELEKQTGAVVVVPASTNKNNTQSTEKVKVTSKSKVEEKTGAKKSCRGWKIAVGVLALLFLIGAVKGCHDEKTRRGAGADVNSRPAVVETLNDTPSQTETEAQSTPDASKEDESKESEESKEAEESKETETQRVVPNYGDITDDQEVMARSKALAQNLASAGITNPRTTLPWDAEYIFQLVKFSRGYYVPETQEEVDIMYLDLLNLTMSDLELEYNGNHIAFVNGADFLIDAINPEQPKISFSETFAEYGQNGVLPYLKWLEQERDTIFRSADGEEITKIYTEVGQSIAEIMKGDGYTMTVDGQPLVVTSERLLADPATAHLVTAELQKILANRWYRMLEDGTVVQATDTWEVTRKNMPEGFVDNVSLDEIIIWINNGCDQQLIDEKFPGGQTFAQRIQGTIEGMALNNYAIHSGEKQLGK